MGLFSKIGGAAGRAAAGRTAAAGGAKGLGDDAMDVLDQINDLADLVGENRYDDLDQLIYDLETLGDGIGEYMYNPAEAERLKRAKEAAEEAQASAGTWGVMPSTIQAIENLEQVVRDVSVRRFAS